MTHDSPAGVHRAAEHFVRSDGYLLSHSIGLPIVGHRDAAAEVADVWERDPAGAWPIWLGIVHRFRAAIAGLIGADADAICPQSGVTSGFTKFVGSLPDLAPGAPVLVTEDAFPSLGFACRRSGLDVRFVPRREDPTDVDTWRRHLDPAPALVLITHVHSDTGERIPVGEIATAARAAGSVVAVDVAQSVGIVPVDVSTWDVDAVFGSCVKWLSGGPGAGWMWVDPAIVGRCHPQDVGWFSHAEPFEFDIHDFRDADGALRFWGGTPTVAPFAVAAHAVETIAEIGVETIRTENQRLLDRLIDSLGDRVTSPHDGGRRGGTALVRAPADAVDQLATEGIAVDHRRGAIRVSPHVHTSDEVIDRLARHVG